GGIVQDRPSVLPPRSEPPGGRVHRNAATWSASFAPWYTGSLAIRRKSVVSHANVAQHGYGTRWKRDTEPFREHLMPCETKPPPVDSPPSAPSARRRAAPRCRPAGRAQRFVAGYPRLHAEAEYHGRQPSRFAHMCVKSRLRFGALGQVARA